MSFEGITKVNADMDIKIYNLERFYTEIFLPNFAVIQEEDRKVILHHLLSNCFNSKSLQKNQKKTKFQTKINANLEKLESMQYSIEAIEKLKTVPLFYESETNRLYTMDCVTFEETGFDLSPYFFKQRLLLVPEKKHKLLIDLGAKLKLSAKDLSGVLNQIKTATNQMPLSKMTLEKVVGILSLIGSKGIHEELSILAPSQALLLEDVKKLYYNDAFLDRIYTRVFLEKLPKTLEL